MTPRDRIALFDRSEGCCEVIENGVRCLRPAAEVDHIVPRAMGGRHGDAKKQNNAVANLRCICLFHHRLRHSGQQMQSL